MTSGTQNQPEPANNPPLHPYEWRLYEAIGALTSELSLELVFKKVTDLSRDLAQASYSALGVLGGNGMLDQFLTSGLTPDERDRIGSLPVGKGVLGLLRTDGKPIRIRDLTKHPDSVGFPTHHPAMKSFLGVPIVYKGRVLGNIYLTFTPDVVVLDIRLPDGSGVETCRDIRAENPEIKVLMLTSYSDEEAVMGSIMAGASGYLLKEIRSQEIVDAIKKIGSGQTLLDPMVTAGVLERIRNGSDADDGWNQLSNQEQRILEFIADGKTNREIAQEIHLSDKTVKNYVSNILGKLEVSRRSQAAAYLAERRTRREFS